MKKRLSSLFLVVFLIIGIAAAVPYKESLKIENFKIKQVQCSNNQLRVLVESKSSSNLKLLFKIVSKKDTKTIFSNQLLKRFEANWFLITTNNNCNELKRLEVNGYIDIDNKKITYINSELSYSFTGKETLIQTEPLLITQPQPIEQATTASSYSYVYVNGKLIERIDSSNNAVFFHTDNLGSIKLITDANGNKIEENEYEPFGNSLSLSSTNNHKYTGKELDKSGLYYYGARYYDSNLGRFTQIDPSYNPSESPYAYVNNNPLNTIDPNGAESNSADATYVSTPLSRIEDEIHRRRVMEIAAEQVKERAFRNIISWWREDKPYTIGKVSELPFAMAPIPKQLPKIALKALQSTFMDKSLRKVKKEFTPENFWAIYKEGESFIPFISDLKSGELVIMEPGTAHLQAAEAMGRNRKFIGGVIFTQSGELSLTGKPEILMLNIGQTSIEMVSGYNNLATALQHADEIEKIFRNAGLVSAEFFTKQVVGKTEIGNLISRTTTLQGVTNMPVGRGN